MLDLVGNSNCWFSHAAARVIVRIYRFASTNHFDMFCESQNHIYPQYDMLGQGGIYPEIKKDSEKKKKKKKKKTTLCTMHYESQNAESNNQLVYIVQYLCVKRTRISLLEKHVYRSRISENLYLISPLAFTINWP